MCIRDRVNRVAVGYQSADDEAAIVAREAPSAADDFAAKAVKCVRMTREHPDIRIGASVRGAIDLVVLADQLAGLRGGKPNDDDTGLDAACAALSGRIRLHESCGRSAEEVVGDLWALAGAEPGEGDDDSGKA